MPWTTEFLQDLGDVNGVNKNYTLSHEPAFVLMAATPITLLARVGSQPREMEYALDADALALGLAPAEDSRPWIIYFYEA